MTDQPDSPLSTQRLRTLVTQARTETSAQQAKVCQPFRFLFWTIRRRHKWSGWYTLWSQGQAANSSQFGAAYFWHCCDRCSFMEVKRIDAP